MITKVRKYMEKHHMVNAGDKIIVGLSGGADSVCLLFLLKELSGQMNFSLEAFHVNHGLREEADEEEAFVKQLCHSWDILCEMVTVDVRGYAKEKHLCLEEAARSLRYDAYEERLRAVGAEGAKIALAHHQNDQAETVLFHLFRGSGIRGLAGIHPVRDCYIRPLLCVGREEIDRCIAENRLEYKTDISNFDTAYARNRIRHDLIPMVEENICRGSVAHIARSAGLVADAVDFLDAMAEETYERLVRETETGCLIDKDRLKQLHPYLRGAVVYEMLWRTCGKKRDISGVHVDSVLKLSEGQSGKRAVLIYGLQAVVQQRELLIERTSENKDKKREKKEKYREEISLMIPGEIRIGVFSESGDMENKNGYKDQYEDEYGGQRIRCRVFPYEKTQIIPCEPYTKWFDYDKIINCPVCRGRREGDYFYCSQTARKKLKDYLINEKIPLSEREKLKVIADGSHIMWIPGYRISSFYKITDETKQILEITISGGKENE